MGMIIIGFSFGLKKIIIFDENSGEFFGLEEVALLSKRPPTDLRRIGGQQPSQGQAERL